MSDDESTALFGGYKPPEGHVNPFGKEEEEQTKDSATEDSGSVKENDASKEEQKEVDIDAVLNAVDHFALDLTTVEAVDIDWAAMEDDLATFQEHDVVKEALQKGVDLRQYCKQIEMELNQKAHAHVDDYMDEEEDFLELQSQIQSCDAVLGRMETFLTSFQGDLGNISKEIKYLQEESLTLSLQLNNRKSVEAKLHSVLKNVVITPECIKGICQGDVDEDYMALVNDLAEKIKAVGTMPDIHALNDIIPQLAMLRDKAISKSREFLLTKIYSLRKSKTNIEIIQNSVLRKYAPLFAFIQKYNPPIEEEIRKLYVETMGKIYTTQLKAYISSLSKAKMDLAAKVDMLGESDTQLKGVFSSKIATKHKASVFALNDRDKVLADIDSPPLVPHVLAEAKAKIPMEQVFRSQMQMLMDAATSEYLFCLDFFAVHMRHGSSALPSLVAPSPPHHSALTTTPTTATTTTPTSLSDAPDALPPSPLEVFEAVFAKIISTTRERVAQMVHGSFDAIGLLLLIRINHHHQLVMARRRVPVLDSFFDDINMLLWPRLKSILDLHLTSLQNATAKLLAPVTLQPHYVTRRYADFVGSLLLLNSSYDDVMLVLVTRQLAANMQELLVRLADECFKHPSEKSTFLINNYYLIMNTFLETGVQNEMVDMVTALLKQATTPFIELELDKYFGEMVQAVRQLEPYLTKTTDETTLHRACNPRTIRRIVQKFNDQWKQVIEELNRTAMALFPNLHNALRVLQSMLTQLVLYYTRFTEVVVKLYPVEANPMVQVQHLLYEIKKNQRDISVMLE